MALPSSGPISLSQVNTEVGQPASSTISLGGTYARTLANKSTGQIAMSDLLGKAWVTQADVVTHLYNNRNTLFNWVFGGSTDLRTANNPYSRYTSASSWTASFSLSGQTLASSTWTTIVISLTATSPVLSSMNINGTAYTATQVYSDYEQRQYVVYANIDYKTVTSVYVYWTHTNANRGSYASVAVIPGKWTSYARQGNHVGSSTNLTTDANSFAIGTYYGNPNGNLYFIQSAQTGQSLQRFDAWWYSNGGLYMVVNPTTGALTHWAYPGTTDNYGAFVVYGYVNSAQYTLMSVY